MGDRKQTERNHTLHNQDVPEDLKIEIEEKISKLKFPDCDSYQDTDTPRAGGENGSFSRALQMLSLNFPKLLPGISDFNSRNFGLILLPSFPKQNPEDKGLKVFRSCRGAEKIF